MRVTDIDWSTWKAQDIATLLFVVRDDQILLIRKKRGLGAGKINGPGGKLDPGETLEQCAVREVQEELGVTPLGLTYRGQHRFQFLDGYTLHCHVYVASDCLGEPTETPEAIPLWTPLTEIPYDEMWADDKHWLPHVLDGSTVDGRYVFDAEVMVDLTLSIHRE